MKRADPASMTHMKLELVSEAQQVCERMFGLLKSLEELPPSSPEGAVPVTEQRIRRILEARRTRAQFFDSELLADPAWDILLELCAAELGHDRLTVSSLCSVLAMPATTTLRWIRTLEEGGLLQRSQDPTDDEQIFVHLTPAGLGAMEALFRATPAAEPFL